MSIREIAMKTNWKTIPMKKVHWYWGIRSKKEFKKIRGWTLENVILRNRMLI